MSAISSSYIQLSKNDNQAVNSGTVVTFNLPGPSKNFTSTTSSVTVLRSGDYQYLFYIDTNGGTAAGYLTRNNVQLPTTIGGTGEQITMSGIVSLAAGDVVRLVAATSFNFIASAEINGGLTLINLSN